MILAALIGLFNTTIAYAQTPQAGVLYRGGAQIELVGSGATFAIPFGFSGQYNRAEKLFEMVSSSGQQINVGYEGKSYADVIAEAGQPITTSDGIVMKPINSEAINNGKFVGEAFAYSGKALVVMNVGAVVVVLKTPEGKGLSLSSAGLGNNYQGFSAQIGLVTPSINYASQVEAASQQQASSSSSRKSKDKEQPLSGASKFRSAKEKKDFGDFLRYIRTYNTKGDPDNKEDNVCWQRKNNYSNSSGGHTTGGENYDYFDLLFRWNPETERFRDDGVAFLYLHSAEFYTTRYGRTTEETWRFGEFDVTDFKTDGETMSASMVVKWTDIGHPTPVRTFSPSSDGEPGKVYRLKLFTPKGSDDTSFYVDGVKMRHVESANCFQ